MRSLAAKILTAARPSFCPLELRGAEELLGMDSV
jgi:hypothetical protein